MRPETHEPSDAPADLRPARARPSPLLAAVRVLPWAVTIGYAIWLGSFAVMEGVLILAILIIPWLVLIGLARRWIDRIEGRLARVVLDVVVITTCVLLASFGGLWMLPGATAFAALDVIEPGTRGARTRSALMLAGMVVLALLPGLLFAFLIWPAALLCVLSLFVSETAPRAPTAEEDTP